MLFYVVLIRPLLSFAVYYTQGKRRKKKKGLSAFFIYALILNPCQTLASQLWLFWEANPSVDYWEHRRTNEELNAFLHPCLVFLWVKQQCWNNMIAIKNIQSVSWLSVNFMLLVKLFKLFILYLLFVFIHNLFKIQNTEVNITILHLLLEPYLSN